MVTAAQLAALERRLRDLEDRRFAGVGVGTSEIRQIQTGAPVTLTSVYNATPGPTGGYSWKKNLLDTTIAIRAMCKPLIEYLDSLTPAELAELRTELGGRLPGERVSGERRGVPDFAEILGPLEAARRSALSQALSQTPEKPR